MKIINKMTDRESMALPEHFQNSRIDNFKDTVSTIKHYSANKLVEILEQKDQEISVRYAAGHLLGLQGDPRVRLLDPLMIDIPSAIVSIGVNESSLDQVLLDYPNNGLLKEWLLKETPEFQVRINHFRISKYLVTNAEFRQFLIETQYEELPSSWPFGVYPAEKANHPVFTVSELAADAYVRWLSDRTGRKFRLLTEFEWEYAASGEAHYQYPWGNKYQADCANTLEEKIYTSTPVGMFPKGDSPFGVSDMAGNVEEYVSDVYAPYPNGVFVEDDLSRTLGSYRICRGGSFTRYADLCRTTRRHGRYSKDIYVIGFRLAEDI